MSINAVTDPAGAAAFRAEQKDIRARRRSFAQEHTTFVRTMQHAVQQYLDMRHQGVSVEDCCRGLEAELREAWPKSVSRFAPACGDCDDSGWIERVCWDRHRCSREVCARNPERTHSYVEQCHCPKGSARVKRTYTPEDAITAAGKTARKKAGGWRQVGA